MDVEMIERGEAVEILPVSEEQETRTEEEKIFDWFLAKFVEKIGRKNINAFLKSNYLLPWGGNTDYNEQRQLLLVLAQELLSSKRLCACLHYCVQKKQIQIALASEKGAGADFNNPTLETIRELIRLQSEQQLREERIAEERRRFLAMSIVKDNKNTQSKSMNRIRKMLAGDNEKDRLAVINFGKLSTSSDEITEKWKEAEKNLFCRQKKAEFNRAMKQFLLHYESYYALLVEIAREKWEEKQEFITVDFLTPFICFDGAKHLLIAMERKNGAWLELVEAIKKPFEKVFPGKVCHAEMKMLEANNFRVDIFIRKKWPAVITKNPCVYCWMTLWATATTNEQRIAITEYLGCSGVFYLSWKWPVLPREHEETIEKYWKLAREIVGKLENGRRLVSNGQQILDLTEEELFKIKLEENKKPMEVTLLQQKLQQWSPKVKVWVDIAGQEDPVVLHSLFNSLITKYSWNRGEGSWSEREKEASS